MKLQYVAHWLNGDGTEEFTHPDLPLSEVDITREIGVGRLTATLPTEFLDERDHEGRRLITEWATAIYVYDTDDLFDAFIVTDVTDAGGTASIDCVGWLGYLSGFLYRDIYTKRDVHAEDVINEIVNSLKSWQGADIGLTTSFIGAFPDMGNPAPGELPVIPGKPTKPPAFTEPQPKRPEYDYDNKGKYERELKEYEEALDAWQERRDAAREVEMDYQDEVRDRENAIEEYENVLDRSAYRMNWWTTHDILQELQAVLGEIDAQARVNHYPQADGTIEHRLEVFSEKHTRVTTVDFTEGENVIQRPGITAGTDKYAKSVVVIGAGEGKDMLRSTYYYEAGGNNGLQRVVTHADKSLGSQYRVSRLADRLVRRRKYWRDFSTLTVIDTDKPGSQYAGFDVGDEIMFRTTDRDGFDVETWVLITRINMQPAEELLEVDIEPIEEVATS